MRKVPIFVATTMVAVQSAQPSSLTSDEEAFDPPPSDPYLPRERATAALPTLSAAAAPGCSHRFETEYRLSAITEACEPISTTACAFVLGEFAVGEVHHPRAAPFVTRVIEELSALGGRVRSIQIIGFADGLPNHGVDVWWTLPESCRPGGSEHNLTDPELARARACMVASELRVHTQAYAFVDMRAAQCFDEPDGGRSGSAFRRVVVVLEQGG